jgi:GNAT superfamily N-acetyltransferase
VVDPDFIKRRTTEAELLDGTRVRIRPIVPEDKERMVAAFERLSPESRYRRFLSPIEELTPDLLRTLTEIDYVDHFAWAALLAEEPGEPGIGVARYVRLPEEPDVAEAAVTVVDEYQGRGLGTLLIQALGAVALEHGIRRFRGVILADNRQIRELLEPMGAVLHFDSGGVLSVDVDLPQQAEGMKDSPAYRVFRALARGEASDAVLRWGALWARSS